MKKVFLAILLTGFIVSCNKIQEGCQECPKEKQEQVAWDVDTTTYDAEQVEDSESDYNTDPTIWVYDGSELDTLNTGDILRIVSIDGATVHVNKIP